MAQTLNLRQIEAFKAVIEHGTVSQAAAVLGVTQPAVSKLLAHLEADTGLSLFDRVRGKLAATRHGMRLYEEVDRIFAGLRQVEQAVDSIRRDEQRTLIVGVLPALSGSFIRRVTMNFLRQHPDVRFSIQCRGSHLLADWLATRQIDVALVGSRVDNPYIDREPMFQHPLMCALPVNHELTRKRVLRPRDLDGLPFIGFSADSQTHGLAQVAFEQARARLNVVLETSTSPTACEFVAAGLGVSLIHPLFADGFQNRLVLRRFDPEMQFHFQLCRVHASRNDSLVETFVQEARAVAAQVSQELR
ncbi:MULTISPECIES: LysR substrate-binding domain-containing protein [unclassified Achromobacter]|uniref:LysR substrate-binding domain-containing protein n=1 Tax=unclassified Achromobacter TaxID=2626865 RepID=UPI000B518F44|nr:MULTISPECIES: LysR substrate-binding domain-containing protein [unclassified Achromobacter]OWT80342.1 LysR family transcriptional regulator [Achromobacter sp. HZ34]OWT82225.1 LysR family transcriptional regulator [Achromobacter sp. HZ28]